MAFSINDSFGAALNIGCFKDVALGIAFHDKGGIATVNFLQNILDNGDRFTEWIANDILDLTVWVLIL